MWIGHCKEIRKLTFPALALRQSESRWQNEYKQRQNALVKNELRENVPTRWLLFVNAFKTRLIVCLSPNGTLVKQTISEI